MVKSAIVGLPPASTRDEIIARGTYVLYQIPFPKKVPLWQGLAHPSPLTPGLKHDTHGPHLIWGAAVVIPIITLVTGCRLISRHQSKSSHLGWDDFFIFWAYLAALVWLIIKIFQVTEGGLGKHSWDSTYEESYVVQRLGHVEVKVTVIWQCLSKISIACFNWRLTGRSSVRWKYVHITMLVLSTIYGVANLLVQFFECRPVLVSFSLIRAGLLANPKDYKCYINEEVYGNALLGQHTILDCTLLLIPIVIIWKLQIPIHQKLQALIPLSLGAVACVATIMRLYYQNLHGGKDLMYIFIHIGDWSVVDLCVTICVTSLPACYGMARRIIRRYRGSSGASKNDSGSGSGGSNAARKLFHIPRSEKTDTSISIQELEHTGKGEGTSRDLSTAESRTLSNGTSETHIANKGGNHSDDDVEKMGEVEHEHAPPPPHWVNEADGDDRRVFSGHGVAMGHPNPREGYEA